ncbi:MAG: PQQ-binding-like beta-propeller repeat protein [Myxococcales bacterium]|nr:PQQ-binding-like beta-propeller repeat protein [Myxococcales bacterium]
MTSRWTLVASVALVGCVGATQKPAFGYRFADNQAADVASVAAALPAAHAPRVSNPSGEPLVVSVTHGEAPRVVALGLDGAERWEASVAAMTRPEVLGDVVLTSDRENVVALDARDGRVLWRRPLGPLAYVGGTRSGGAIIYVTSVGAGGGATRVGDVRAVDARSGSALWSYEIAGTLGRPAARGAFVFIPWDRQNVAILEIATGLEKARLRTTDDVIAWVADHPSGIYYGANGVYRFDTNSHAGTRRGQTHRPPPVTDLPRDPMVADDGFFPMPGTRSARGRIRVYFAPEGTTEGRIDARGGRFYFVYFRYVMAYDDEGALVWVRMLDEDVIQAEAVASGLFTVGEQGSFRVLDRETGNDRWTGGAERELASAGLDLGGFDPAGEPGEPRPLKLALAEMAGDADNRLVAARAYAIEQLGAIPEPDVTGLLLDLYAQRSVPGALRETISTVLRQREVGVELLVEALSSRYDYLDERPSPPLDLLVPALLEQRRTDAVSGLVAHLLDHETPLAVLGLVARAIVELGDASVVPALQAFLVLYHADSSFAQNAEPLAVVAEGIFRHGGEEGRAMLTALRANGRVLANVSTAIEELFTSEAQRADARARALAEAEAEAAAAAAAAEREGRPMRLSQAQINGVFAEQTEGLRACFEAELERDPRFSQLRVVFILENTGIPTDIQYAPSGAELVGCLEPVVSALRFPPFRQRRQRGTFTVTLRGGEDTTAAAPTDRFWWSRAERLASDGPIGRPWWEVRQAPARGPAAPPPSDPTPPSTAPPTQGGGAGQPWWLEGEQPPQQQPPQQQPPQQQPPQQQPPQQQPPQGGSPWWLADE